MDSPLSEGMGAAWTGLRVGLEGLLDGVCDCAGVVRDALEDVHDADLSELSEEDSVEDDDDEGEDTDGVRARARRSVRPPSCVFVGVSRCGIVSCSYVLCRLASASWPW